MNKQKQNTALQGKRIVLIGGTSGFGLATAHAAAAEGAEVIVVSGNSQKVDQALTGLPASAKGITANVADEKQIRDLFKQTGSFDHLVFTAGEALQFAGLQDIELETAKHFFNVRFWGALLGAKYAQPHLREGGSITLTNGTVNLRPRKGWAVAASVTGAIESLTKALAVEMAPIRVNAVCAGVVRTNLWSNIPETEREAMFAGEGSKLLTGRVGEAHEIAEAYLYLMKNGFSTGQVIVADGGGVLV